MTLIQRLLEALNRIFSRQRLRLSRLLHLWTILRRCFRKKDPKSQKLPPSNDAARTRNEYKPHLADEVVIHCSSLAPYHISPNGSQSSHDLTAERSPRHLLPGSALGSRRSRSHTPSARNSQSSSPVGIVMSMVEPSPIEDESGPSALFAKPGASQINLEDYDHLELTTRYLPPRSRTPSMRATSIRTASIRASSLRAPSPSARIPSPLFKPSLRSIRAVSPTPSRQELTPPVHIPSPFTGSHCLIPAGDIVMSDLADTNERFYPTAPEFFERYERKIYVPNEETEFKIDPLKLSFKIEHDHSDWDVHIHPEGARYFAHRTRKIFTDADLCDVEITTVVTSFIEQMDEFIRAQSIDIPATADLVFDIIRAESDGKIYCAYYFADHANRSIFWLDTYYAHYFPIWYEIKGATSVSHVGHIIESQYWYHCQLFPTCLPLTLELVDFMRDLLIHTIGDMVTSVVSTSPYDMSDLQQILALANNMRKNVTTSKGVAPGSISCLGRFMYVFVRQRFFHFYGQPSARLERDRSVYGTVASRRTLLITSLSPLLFFAPEVHLRALEKIWVDNILNEATWATFISKLTSEWQEFILYATVLLNANVAFLAIQSVDKTSDSPSRSAAQITSYLSVITSIGSIILGLLLVRQNRSKAKETSRDALLFLNAQKHEMLGLETLAIMYSLPYALLMWGMVSFLAAFSLMCLVASNATVRVLVGGAWLIITCMVLWCITISWDAKNSNRWYMWLINFGVLLWKALREKIRVSAPPILQTLRKFPSPWRRASVDSGQTVV